MALLNEIVGTVEGVLGDLLGEEDVTAMVDGVLSSVAAALSQVATELEAEAAAYKEQYGDTDSLKLGNASTLRRVATALEEA